MKYRAAVGDVVLCVKTVDFVGMPPHLAGFYYEVKEGEEAYYSLMSVFETERHQPHEYVVYALAGYIIEEDA
jgi:hypothetical protein